MPPVQSSVQKSEAGTVEPILDRSRLPNGPRERVGPQKWAMPRAGRVGAALGEVRYRLRGWSAKLWPVMCLGHMLLGQWFRPARAGFS